MLVSLQKNLFKGFLFCFIFTTFNRELLIFGYDARILSVVIGIFFLVSLLISRLARGEFPKISFAGTNVFILLFFIAALASNVAWISSPIPFVSDQFQTVFLANSLNLFFIVVLAIGRDSLKMRDVSLFTLISGLVLWVSMVVVYLGLDLRNYSSQYAGGYSDGISGTPLGPVRFAGYAQDPNFASLFMMILAVIAVYGYRRTKSWPYFLVILISISGLVLSFSKTIVAMLFIALLLATSGKYILGAISKEVLLIAGFAVSVVAIFPSVLLLPTTTLGLRGQMWTGAMRDFFHSPIFGNGLTSARASNLVDNWAVQVHSTIIQSLKEVGFLGLFLIFFAIRRNVMSGISELSFISILYFGTALTYETTSHAFTVYVLFLLPLAMKMDCTNTRMRASIFVINGIAKGGAERVVQNMANNASPGEQVFIFMFEPQRRDDYYLKPGIVVKSIDSSQNFLRIPLQVWQLNRQFEYVFATYDVSLATVHLPYAQLITRLTRFYDDFIFVNHGLFGLDPKSIVGRIITAVNNRQKVVAVSQQLLDHESTINFKIRTSRSTVIYNPLDYRSIENQLNEDVKREKLVVSVGRYASPKNQIAGIKAFQISGLAQQGYKYELMGEGPDRGLLEAEIKELGLEKSVELKGFVAAPFGRVQVASALIHSAEYESFGMAIVEAHYCSCPVVAFDVPYGARETMPGPLRRYLAPRGDVKALAEKLILAVSEEYPHAATTELIRMTEPQRVMKRYYELYECWRIGKKAPPASVNSYF